MDDSNFDVLIVGTGLSESIVSAALAKAGYRVLHVDINSYYGKEEASLSLDEFIQWSSNHPDNVPGSRYHSVKRSGDILLPQSRQYAISLRPAVIPSVGPSIASLVSSGVAKYSEFRLLDGVAVITSSNTIKSVFGNKEEVFKNKEISLIDKRRLMRFLTYAGAQDFTISKDLEGKEETPFVDFLRDAFKLNSDLADIVAYSLSYCVSSTDPTLPALRRLNRYLNSVGRFGSSPFLLCYYGGVGEIVQGFCRSAAVGGAVYILGHEIISVSSSSSATRVDDPLDPLQLAEETPNEIKRRYNVQLSGLPDVISCNLIVSAMPDIPTNLHADALQISLSSAYNDFPAVTCVARCVAIVDQAISFKSSDPVREVVEYDTATPMTETSIIREALDSAILVYPPNSLVGGSDMTSATVFITGEGTNATPKGKWLIYIAVPLLISSNNPEAHIWPYLTSVLSLAADPSVSPITPLFTTFYVESILPSLVQSNGTRQNDVAGVLVPPIASFTPLPDSSDVAFVHAETIFQEATKVLDYYPSTSRHPAHDDTLHLWPPLENEELSETEW